MEATRRGHNHIVELLLEQDLDLTARLGPTIMTPMMCAAHDGTLLIFTTILRMGPDLTLKDLDGCNLAHFIACRGLSAFLLEELISTRIQ